MNDIRGKFFDEATPELVQCKPFILYFWVYGDGISSFFYFWSSYLLVERVI